MAREHSIEFQALVDTLKANTQLSTIIGASVELKREGTRLLGLCPFHTEKTPSFSVNDARHAYHCFGCGAHGDVFDWLEKRAGMPLVAAVQHLGGSVPTNGATPHTADADTWHPIIPPPDDAPRPNLAGYDTVYTYADPDGAPLFYIRRRNAHGSVRKQFHPLTFGILDGVRGWHPRQPPAPRPLYGLDRLAAKPDATVLLCEGEKAADAAALQFLDHAAITWPGGAGAIQHTDFSPLLARSVIIWPDNDSAGRKSAAELLVLLPHATILTVSELPAKADAADLSVDDPGAWLAQHLPAPEPARTTTRDPQPARPPPVEHPDRPTVHVYHGLRHIAADQGLAALHTARVAFYQRDRYLVRPTLAAAKASDGAVVLTPNILPVTLPILARELGRAAEWQKTLKSGEAVRIDPPREVVEQIAAMSGEWPFPPLSGVIGAPTMRPDGSILASPGYDHATGLCLINPPDMPPVANHPSRDDAVAACATLLSLLTEFPFADDASRSVALSMLLTPVLRGALGGAVPMHVVAAPQAGSGKSYLQDLASMLATGERCAVINIAPKPDETEKRLIGAALAGFPIIAIDNCNGLLEGDFLAQVTERPLLQLRPLGSSAVIRIPNTFATFANGNNIQIAADLVRRSVLCSLDANLENPEDREFSEDPVQAVANNRGPYIHAAITISRAYHCAGRPGALRPTPSFEGWSNLVRSALVWLDQPDPNTNTANLRSDDPKRTALRQVFTGWTDVLQLNVGYKTAEIIAAADTFDHTSGQHLYADFRAALMAVASTRAGDKIDPARLGSWLRSSTKIISNRRKLLMEQQKNVISWSMRDA